MLSTSIIHSLNKNSLKNFIYNQGKQWRNINRCLERAENIKAHVSEHSITLALQVLSECFECTGDSFLNVIETLEKISGLCSSEHALLEKKIYQCCLLKLPTPASMRLISMLLTHRIQVDADIVPTLLCGRYIDESEVDSFHVFIANLKASNPDFYVLASNILRIVDKLAFFSIKLNKSLIQFLQQKILNTKDYVRALPLFKQWLCDHINIFHKHDVGIIISQGTLALFLRLSDKNISFGPKDFSNFILYTVKDASFDRRLSMLLDSGLALHHGDISEDLKEIIQSTQYYEITRDILLPIFQDYHIQPHVQPLKKMIQLYQDKGNPVLVMLRNYLSQHQEHKELFGGTLWDVFCELTEKDIPYHASVDYFFERFPLFQKGICCFIFQEYHNGESVESIVYSLKEYFPRLIDLEALYKQGYSFCDDEVSATLSIKNYSFDALTNIAKLKELLEEGSISTLIADWGHLPHQTREILRLYEQGYSLCSEIYDILYYAGAHSELLITSFLQLEANKSLKEEDYYLLDKAFKNAVWIMFGLSRNGSCSLSDGNEQIIRFIFKSMCEYYNVLLSEQELGEIFDANLKNHEPSSIIIRQVEEIIKSLQELNLLEDLFLFKKIVCHRDPVSLFEAYLYLGSQGLIYEFYDKVIEQQKCPPYSYAHALVLWKGEGISDITGEILRVFNTKSIRLVKIYAQAIAIYYKKVGAANFSSEQINALIQAKLSAVNLVRGWTCSIANPLLFLQYNDFPYKQLGLADLFVSMQFSEKVNLANELSRADFTFLCEALSMLDMVGVALTRDIYDRLKNICENNYDAIETQALLYEEIVAIISQIQKTWLENQLNTIVQQVPSTNAFGQQAHFLHLKNLFERYLIEDIFERGNIKTLRAPVTAIIEFLVSFPKIGPYFEEIAAAYTRACVNQPVQGMFELSSWVFVAQKSDPLQKIAALSYRYTLEYLSFFVEKQAIVPTIVKVEASNVLLQIIHQRLCVSGVAMAPWLNIVETNIAHQNGLAEFISSQESYDVVHQIIDRLNKITLEDLAEYVLSDARPFIGLWGALVFPELVDQIDHLMNDKVADLKAVINYREELLLNCEVLYTSYKYDNSFILQAIELPTGTIEEKLLEPLEEEHRKLYQHVLNLREDNERAAFCSSPQHYKSVIFYRDHALEKLYEELTMLTNQKEKIISNAIKQHTEEILKNSLNESNVIIFNNQSYKRKNQNSNSNENTIKRLRK